MLTYWIFFLRESINLRPSVPIAVAYPSELVSSSISGTSGFFQVRVFGLNSMQSPQKKGNRNYLWEIRSTVIKREEHILVDFTIDDDFLLFVVRGEYIFATTHVGVITRVAQHCKCDFCTVLFLRSQGPCVLATLTSMVFQGYSNL